MSKVYHYNYSVLCVDCARTALAEVRSSPEWVDLFTVGTLDDMDSMTVKEKKKEMSLEAVYCEDCNKEIV